MAIIGVNRISNHHPIGLWCLSAVSALYCFAFGTITSLLVLYLNNSLQLKATVAYDLFAATMSLLFTLPLIGGYLAGQLGYKYAAIVGIVVCMAGAFILSYHDVTAMYLGVSAFVVGNGLLTPATYSLVGLCYEQQDSRRDSGYTLYYLLFNLGFLVSIVVGGYLSTYLGFNKTFFIASLAIFCTLVVFLKCMPLIRPAPGSSMIPQVKWKTPALIVALFIAAMIGIPISMALLEHVKIDNFLLWILTIGASLAMLWIAKEHKNKLIRYRLLAFLFLSIISVAFWSLYMLEPSLLTVFIERNVDRRIGSFTIPPSTYYSLDSFFIILLGVFFSGLWHHLAKQNKDISLPAKFAISLLVMGLGYLIIVLGIQSAGADHLTQSFWIVLAYVFFATAELFISPIGLSMVGRLLPKGKEGLGMGVWQLFTGLSAIISGYLANMAAVPTHGTPAITNPIFAEAIFKIGLGTLLTGIVVTMLIPKLKQLIK